MCAYREDLDKPVSDQSLCCPHEIVFGPCSHMPYDNSDKMCRLPWAYHNDPKFSGR